MERDRRARRSEHAPNQVRLCIGNITLGGSSMTNLFWKLSGFLTAPLFRRTDGEPVDISLVIPAACIVSAISPYITIPNQSLLPHHIQALNSSSLVNARQAVVMVQVGQTWASGVVISKQGRKSRVVEL